jgi:SAM-dependent methyltransferase
MPEQRYRSFRPTTAEPFRRPVMFENDNAKTHNARAWDKLARQQVPLARPAADGDLTDPLAKLDPLGWLGGEIRNQKVLCLAAGGGRHSAIYASMGARVTVVDISGEMLALDRAVATERKLDIRTVQTSMDELAMFADGEFEVVIHPVSTCYLADVSRTFAEVARVTKVGGIYISQHKTPTSLQAEIRPSGAGYRIVEPYYRNAPLPPAEPCRVREPGTLEFVHRWEQLIGGMCRAGFVIEDLVEPMHAEEKAPVGSFAHRSQYVAPYVRIKARRVSRQRPVAVM